MMMYWEKHPWKLMFSPTDKGFKETWWDPHIGWPYPNWGSFEERGIVKDHAETADVTQDM